MNTVKSMCLSSDFSFFSSFTSCLKSFDVLTELSFGGFLLVVVLVQKHVHFCVVKPMVDIVKISGAVFKPLFCCIINPVEFHKHSFVMVG